MQTSGPSPAPESQASRSDKRLRDDFITSVQYARATRLAFGMHSPAFVAAAKVTVELSAELRGTEEEVAQPAHGPQLLQPSGRLR
jgi:hypothetical protein